MRHARGDLAVDQAPYVIGLVGRVDARRMALLKIDPDCLIRAYGPPFIYVSACYSGDITPGAPDTVERYSCSYLASKGAIIVIRGNCSINSAHQTGVGFGITLAYRHLFLHSSPAIYAAKGYAVDKLIYICAVNARHSFQSLDRAVPLEKVLVIRVRQVIYPSRGLILENSPLVIHSDRRIFTCYYTCLNPILITRFRRSTITEKVQACGVCSEYGTPFVDASRERFVTATDKAASRYRTARVLEMVLITCVRNIIHAAC